MKLTELQPRWLLNENGQKWFLFKSPAGSGNWLTCRNFVWDTKNRLETIRLYELCPDLRGQPIVGCNQNMAWRIDGDFENLTVSPSIDASSSGNWHGFIQNGMICGGI